MKELRHTLYATIVFCMVWHAASKSIEGEIVENCVPTICSDSNDHTFDVGRTYTYKYDVESSTKLSGGAEDGRSTTFRIAALVQVQAHTKCHITVTLESAEISADGEQIPEKQLEIFRSQLTEHPVEVNWQDGEVVSLCTHAEESTWSKNLKKGLVSSIQNTAIGTGDEHVVDEIDIFGKCKTTYRSTSGEDTKTIIKEKDLSQCTNGHNFVESSILFSHYDAVSARSTLLQSTQKCTQTWGNGNVLQGTQCSETHLFRPLSYRTNGAKTTVSQSLNFVSVKRAIPSQVLPPSSTVKSSLLFTPEKETFDRISNYQDLVALLEDACGKFERPSSFEMMPAAYITIIKKMKQLSVDDLERTWELIQLARICPSNLEKIRSLFLNSIPMCVSNNCVEFAVRLLENNNPIKLEKTKDWYNAFAMIPNPTERMISLVSVAASHPKAPSEVYLSLGTMIHRYCKKASNCLTSSAVVNSLQQFQMALGTNCHTTNDEHTTKIIFSLRALGNAGVSTATGSLNSCIAESRNTNEVRISAMHAMRRMDCRSDKSAVRSLFMDASEDSELRIVAYTTLMRCPSMEMISYILHVMENEEVDQVGSYVWSHLMEVQKSSDPLKAYIQGLLQSSILSEKFKKDRRKYSSYFESSLFSETLNLGAEFDGSLVWSPKSFVPRSVRANITVDLFGSAVNLLEIGGRIEGLENMIKEFLGSKVEHNEFLSTLLNRPKAKRPKRDVEDEDMFKNALKKIKSNYPHINKNNEATGSAYIRTFGNEIGFYELNAEEAEAESWITTAQIAFKLFTGTDFNFQHQKVLMDSMLEVPTGAGIPLKLKVTSASATDVTLSGRFDFTNYMLKGNAILDTLCKPRAVLDISASMGVELSSIITSGVELDSKLSIGFELNGHVGILEGKKLEIRLDVPQDTTKLITFNSKFYTSNGYSKDEINIPVISVSDCTAFGAATIGMKVCTTSQSHSIPQNAEETTPFIMMLAPYNYQLAVHKTDPGITHYLLEGSYNIMVKEENFVPDAAEFSFYVGTPESYIPRNFSVNLMFQRSKDDARLYISTLDKSILLSGQLRDEEDLKEGSFKVTVNRKQVYGIKGHMSKETTTDGATKWLQSVNVETPFKSPSINCNTSYAMDKSLGIKMKISDVMAEDIIFNANVEKLHIMHRNRYSGDLKLFVPQLLDLDGELRSGIEGGGENMRLQMKYGLFGRNLESLILQHRYHVIPTNTKGGTKWSSTSEFISSQFPAINNKIETQYNKKPTGVETSLNVNYGDDYSRISNQKKITIKQYYTNLTSSGKMHYDGGLIVVIPSHDIDYEFNTVQIIDWEDYKHFESAINIMKFGTNIAGFSMKALDESIHYLNLRGEFAMTTPWGELHSKHRLSRADANTISYLSLSGLGRTPQLQVQVKGDITNLENKKQIILYAYQPLSIFRQDEEIQLQELPPAEDYALFNASYNKARIDDGNYAINFDVTSTSILSEDFNLRMFSHRSTSANKNSELNYGASFQHSTENLQISNTIKKTDNEQDDYLNSTRSIELRMEYTLGSKSPIQAISFGGDVSLLTPTYSSFAHKSRFGASIYLNHNLDKAAYLIPRESIFKTNGGLTSFQTAEEKTHVSAEWQTKVTGITEEPLSSKVSFEAEYSSKLNANYSISATAGTQSSNDFKFEAHMTNQFENLLNFHNNINAEINTERILCAKLSNSRHEFIVQYLHDLRQFKAHWFKDIKLSLMSSLLSNKANGELTFKHINNDMTISKIHSLLQLDIPEKKLNCRFSHNIALLEQNSIPKNFDVNGFLHTNNDKWNSSFSITQDEKTLVSISTKFNMISAYTRGVEIELNHGIEDIMELGLEKYMKLTLDAQKDDKTLYNFNVLFVNGENHNSATGKLEVNSQAILHLYAKYNISYFGKQAAIDVGVKDLLNPFWFKLKFNDNFLNANIELGRGLSEEIVYTGKGLLSHNIVYLNSVLEIPHDSEISTSYAFKPHSDVETQRLDFKATSAQHILTLTHQIDFNAMQLKQWMTYVDHNIAALEEIGLPMNYNLTGVIDAGMSSFSVNMDQITKDRNSQEVNVKSAAFNLGIDEALYYLHISTFNNRIKNEFNLTMNFSKNGGQSQADFQLEHTYDRLENELLIPRDLRGNMKLKYKSLTDINTEINFFGKTIFYSHVAGSGNCTLSCGVREENDESDIIASFRTQFINNERTTLQFDINFLQENFYSIFVLTQSTALAEIQQNFDVENAPSVFKMSLDLSTGAGNYGLSLLSAVDKKELNITTVGQVVENGYVLSSSVKHNIVEFSDEFPLHSAFNAALASDDSGTKTVHAEVVSQNESILLFTSSISDNGIDFKVKSPNSESLHTINFDVSVKNSVLHSKFLLEFASRQSTKFVFDITSEDHGYTIEFLSRNSNAYFKTLGISDQSSGTINIKYDVGQKAEMELGINLLTSNKFQLETNWKLVASDDVFEIDVSSSHNQDIIYIPSNIRVNNKLTLLSDSIQNQFSFTKNGVTKTLKTEINYMILPSHPSTSLSISLSLVHDFESFRDSFKIPNSAEIIFDADYERNSAIAYEETEGDIKSMRVSVGLSANNDSIAKATGKIIWDEISSLDISYHSKYLPAAQFMKLSAKMFSIGNDSTLSMSYRSPEFVKGVEIHKFASLSANKTVINIKIVQDIFEDISKINFTLHHSNVFILDANQFQQMFDMRMDVNDVNILQLAHRLTTRKQLQYENIYENIQCVTKLEVPFVHEFFNEMFGIDFGVFSHLNAERSNMLQLVMGFEYNHGNQQGILQFNASIDDSVTPFNLVISSDRNTFLSATINQTFENKNSIPSTIKFVFLETLYDERIDDDEDKNVTTKSWIKYGDQHLTIELNLYKIRKFNQLITLFSFYQNMTALDDVTARNFFMNNTFDFKDYKIHSFVIKDGIKKVCNLVFRWQKNDLYHREEITLDITDNLWNLDGALEHKKITYFYKADQFYWLNFPTGIIYQGNNDLISLTFNTKRAKHEIPFDVGLYVNVDINLPKYELIHQKFDLEMLYFRDNYDQNFDMTLVYKHKEASFNGSLVLNIGINLITFKLNTDHNIKLIESIMPNNVLSSLIIPTRMDSGVTHFEISNHVIFLEKEFNGELVIHLQNNSSAQLKFQNYLLNFTASPFLSTVKVSILHNFNGKNGFVEYGHTFDKSRAVMNINLDNIIYALPEIDWKFKILNGKKPEVYIRLSGIFNAKLYLKLKKSSNGNSLYYKIEHRIAKLDNLIDRYNKGSFKIFKVQDLLSIQFVSSSVAHPTRRKFTILLRSQGRFPASSMYSITVQHNFKQLEDYIPVIGEGSIEWSVGERNTVTVSALGKLNEKSITVNSNLDRNQIYIDVLNSFEQSPSEMKIVLYRNVSKTLEEVGFFTKCDDEAWKLKFSITDPRPLTQILLLEINHNDVEVFTIKTSYDFLSSYIVSLDVSRNENYAAGFNLPLHINKITTLSQNRQGGMLASTVLIDQEPFSITVTATKTDEERYYFNIKIDNEVSSYMFDEIPADINHRLEFNLGFPAVNSILKVNGKEVMSINFVTRYSMNETPNRYSVVFKFKNNFDHFRNSVKDVEVSYTLVGFVGGFRNGKTEFIVIADKQTLAKIKLNTLDDLSADVDFGEYKMQFYDREIGKEIVVAMPGNPQYFAASWNLNPRKFLQFNAGAFQNDREKRILLSMDIDQTGGLKYGMIKFNIGLQRVVINIKEFRADFESMFSWNYVFSSTLDHSFENVFELIPSSVELDITNIARNSGVKVHSSTFALSSDNKVIVKKDIRLTQSSVQTTIQAEMVQEIFETVKTKSISSNLEINHRFEESNFDIKTQLTGIVNQVNKFSLQSGVSNNNAGIKIECGGKYDPISNQLFYQNEEFVDFKTQFNYNCQTNKLTYTMSAGSKELSITFDATRDAAQHTIQGSLVHNMNDVFFTENASFQLSIEYPQFLHSDKASIVLSTMWVDQNNEVQTVNAQSDYTADFETRNYEFTTALKHSLNTLDEAGVTRNNKVILTCQHGNSYGVKLISMGSEILSVTGHKTQDTISTVNILATQNLFTNFPLKKTSAKISYDLAGKLCNISVVYNDLLPASINVHMNEADHEIELSGKVEFGFLGENVFDIKTVGANINYSISENHFKLSVNSLMNDVVYFNSSTNLALHNDFVVLAMDSTTPVNMKIEASYDSMTENEITLIGSLNCEEFSDEKYVKVKLGYMKDDVLGKILILLKSTINAQDDVLFGFNVRDLSQHRGYSYAIETIAKCLSSDVNTRFICKLDNYNSYKHFGAALKYGMTDMSQWRVNVTQSIGNFDLMIQSPLTEEVVLKLNDDDNQKQISLKLSNIVTLRGTSRINREQSTVTISHGFEDLRNDRSWKMQSQLNKNINGYSVRFSADDTSTNLLLASLSMGNDNLQLHWSSDDTTAQIIQRKLKQQDYLISEYISLVTQNTKVFAQKIYPETGEMEKLDYAEEFARNIVSGCSNVASNIVQLPVVVSTSGRSFKTIMDTMLSHLRLPMDELRIVYYENIIVQLKEDITMAVANYTQQEDQTKLRWMFTHLLSEIINHKIDKTEILLYTWLQSVVPSSTDFLIVSDEFIEVEIPIQNFVSNSYIQSLSIKVEALLGKPFITRPIDSLLEFYEMPLYNKVMSLWSSDDGFLNFPGYAHMIGSSTIVSFDGLVQNIHGEGCSHLLAHDMEDDSFTLIMEKDEENRISYLFKLTSNGNIINIKVTHEMKVELNNSVIDFPFKINDIEISQRITGLEIFDKENGVKFFCESTTTVSCHIKVDPKHHGRVAGALGTMDGEKYNDHIAADNNLSTLDISVWKLPSSAMCPDQIFYAESAVEITSDECICDKLFKSSDSTLNPCYGFVPVDGYYENCRRNNCNATAACNLITTYRYMCNIKGIKTNVPEDCEKCRESDVTVDRTSIERTHDVVLVINQDCHKHMYSPVMELMEKLGERRHIATRFGLVTHTKDEHKIHTMGGELFADYEAVSLAIKNSEGGSVQGQDVGLYALYAATLHPFAPTAKKSVVMVTCGRCEESNEISIDEVAATITDLEIDFTIMKDGELSYEGKKARSERVFGFDSERIYTRRRRIKSFPISNHQPEYETDACTNVLTETRGTFWNANILSSRSARFTKRVSNIMLQKLQGDLSALMALTMCRECRCVPVNGGTLHRDVCSAC